MVKANPFRYVGKFGVQYDEDTKLYFMGWREYDPKIGRFLVADEYEGEDDNPISFNRYLYAESDPVNNIDPDGYAPKWLKKLSKGVKKAAKATYNFAIGDDIKTIKSKKTKWYQKAGAAISIASNFIPGGGLASKAVKAAIKGTSKAYKAAKATKKATTKIKRSPSKKVSSKVNKKPKTVAAKPIRTAPKVQSKAKVKVAATVKTKPKIKTYVAPKPNRGATVNRVAKNAAKTEKHVASPDVKISSQSSSTKATGSSPKFFDKPMAGDNVGVMLNATGNSIGNGKQYSTLYEASTGNGASRSAHRNAANKEFYNKMAKNTQFKNAINDFFGYDVMEHMKSGKSALKNPSKDWVWHHPADKPGVVKLIPKNQHQSPLLQDILHPGPNGQGGFGLFK